MPRLFKGVYGVGSLVLTCLVSACATTPQGRAQLMLTSRERAERTADRTFRRLKNREYVAENKEDRAFVDCVVRALDSSPHRQWDVVIFKNDEANAFALSGNKIGVNSGLLRVTVNQDQLAAVLGHEMGHVIAQHGRERMSQQTALATVDYIADVGSAVNPKLAPISLATKLATTIVQFGILYPFSRLQENEADLIGLDLMTKAGFDPKEAIEFWKNMDAYAPQFQESEISDHPTTKSRVENIRSHLKTLLPSKAQGPTCTR